MSSASAYAGCAWSHTHTDTHTHTCKCVRLRVNVCVCLHACAFRNARGCVNGGAKDMCTPPLPDQCWFQCCGCFVLLSLLVVVAATCSGFAGSLHSSPAAVQLQNTCAAIHSISAKRDRTGVNMSARQTNAGNSARGNAHAQSKISRTACFLSGCPAAKTLRQEGSTQQCCLDPA